VLKRASPPPPFSIDKVQLTWESIAIKLIDHDTPKKSTETRAWKGLRLQALITCQSAPIQFQKEQ
jgi:hypothetical protein